MINKIADWYRIAEGKPQDETIEKRKSSIVDLVKKIVEAEDVSNLCALISISVSGPNLQNDSHKPVIDTIMNSLCEHQPSLPTDPLESLNIIRACAIITLGEIISQGKPEKPNEIAIISSTILLSAIGIRQAFTERMVHKAIGEVINLAQHVLKNASDNSRKRQSAIIKLEKIAPDADIKKAFEVMKSIVLILEDQIKIDKEEIEVLWWMRARFSIIMNKNIGELNTPIAAYVSALELADKCILPPPDSVREMLDETILIGRNKKEMKTSSLLDFLQTINSTLSTKITYEHVEVEKIVLLFSDIFPVSSYLMSKQTFLEHPKHFIQEVSPLIFARQLFNERITQKMIYNMV
jgi:hypothetical protein